MSVADEVRRYLEGELAQGGAAISLDDHAPLIGTVIDSLGLLNLVLFVEVQFDIVVDDTEVTVSHFRTIADLAAFVTRKQTAEAAGEPR